MLRSKYIPPYFYNNPNVYNKKGMLSICHVQMFVNLLENFQNYCNLCHIQVFCIPVIIMSHVTYV